MTVTCVLLRILPRIREGREQDSSPDSRASGASGFLASEKPERVPAPAPPEPIETTLPHTGTIYPLIGLAGFLLLGAGIALRFRS